MPAFYLTFYCSLSTHPLTFVRILGEPMTEARKQTVLIADSSIDNRRSLGVALVDAGFEVVEVGSGTRTLDAVRNGDFDVVLTDAWMPDLDGISMIRSIRQLSPRSRILVVTEGGPGMSIASAAALARVWGAVRTYVRPFDIADLLLDIRALLPGGDTSF